MSSDNCVRAAKEWWELNGLEPEETLHGMNRDDFATWLYQHMSKE